MRLLLDECVDRRLARLIAGHNVITVVRAGWSGIRNSQLLSRAANHQFAALITVDKRIADSADLASLGISVVILVAKSNRLVDLEPLIPRLLEALENLTAGCVVRVVEDPSGQLGTESNP